MGRSSQTSTVVNDPWSSMPDWMEAYLRGETEARQNIVEDARRVAGDLGGTPRQIAGMTPAEREARGIIEGSVGRQGGLSEQARAALDRSAPSPGYGQYENTYTGDRLSDILEGRDFTSDYTSQVVDTTLEGMRREAARRALERESRGAAIGGISNTRSAVREALADQLDAMNMAQTEAKLRDEAFRFGASTDLQAAGLLDRSDQYRSGLDFDVQRAATEADQYLMGRDLDLARAYDTLASSDATRSLVGADWLRGYGMDQRNIRQQRLDAARNAPADAMTWLSSIFSGAQGAQLPMGSTTTSTQPGPSTGSQILGGLATGVGILGKLGILSDENAKTDIEPLDPKQALDAVRDFVPATYAYRPGLGHRDDRHAGLIAQSVESAPGAVVEDPETGLKAVDPYPVLATIAAAVQELDRRTRDDDDSEREH